jgi:hypothetical protein
LEIDTRKLGQDLDRAGTWRCGQDIDSLNGLNLAGFTAAHDHDFFYTVRCCGGGIGLSSHYRRSQTQGEGRSPSEQMKSHTSIPFFNPPKLMIQGGEGELTALRYIIATIS